MSTRQQGRMADTCQLNPGMDAAPGLALPYTGELCDDGRRTLPLAYPPLVKRMTETRRA